MKREAHRLENDSQAVRTGSQRRLVAAVLVAALAGSVGAQDAARSVGGGVYTPAQAQRGERLFESICTSCHELDEFTGSGAYFELAEGQSLWETFEYMSTEMPEDDPGSLELEEYAAVLAYLLRAYGLPSGAVELPVDREPLEILALARPPPPRS